MFIEGNPPKGFKPDFESFLFNDERHRLLQSSHGWQSYSIVREDKKKILASVHFHLENGQARSPLKAPFGSVGFSKTLPPAELYEFLRNVGSKLKDSGIRAVQIKNSPQIYDPAASSLLEVLLVNLGFHVRQAEVNAAIIVDERNYDELLEGWELRKLKQAKKAKLTFHEMPIHAISEVYEFIKGCREERQQSLSMTLTELMRTITLFPDDFVLFGVYQNKELAAASISIRVSKHILYNFYSAHPRKMDSLSPVVLLMQGIYHWSQKQKITLIDLGTSALDGQPNFGLLDFKIRLHGVLSAKFTFEKHLQ
jgi:Acetyltransferase (GNAT) domain